MSSISLSPFILRNTPQGHCHRAASPERLLGASQIWTLHTWTVSFRASLTASLRFLYLVAYHQLL